MHATQNRHHRALLQRSRQAQRPRATMRFLDGRQRRLTADGRRRQHGRDFAGARAVAGCSSAAASRCWGWARTSARPRPCAAGMKLALRRRRPGRLLGRGPGDAAGSDHCSFGPCSPSGRELALVMGSRVALVGPADSPELETALAGADVRHGRFAGAGAARCTIRNAARSCFASHPRRLCCSTARFGHAGFLTSRFSPGWSRPPGTQACGPSTSRSTSSHSSGGRTSPDRG